jgi:ADP-ribose pyrophosphatase
MGHSKLQEMIQRERSIYQGKIVHLLELTVELPNGKPAKREVVRHPGAVAILAESRTGQLICVEQYRTAPNEVLLEIPAGKLEPGEDPKDCAFRELAEETGYRAGALTHVGEFFTSPGFADEKIHLFYATNLTAGDVNPDEDEFVQSKFLSQADVEWVVDQGHVRDAKTLIGFLWWLRKRGHSS